MLNWELSRRGLLTFSAGLFLARGANAEDRERSVLCWKLDDHGNTAHESRSDVDDAIFSRAGHAIWVGEGRDRALRLDGYSVWIAHPSTKLALQGAGLTIAAWLALESHPVEQAAIVDIQTKVGKRIRFSVDKWGYLHFGTEGTASKSVKPVPRGVWTHVAATLHGSMWTLYQNAATSGEMAAPGYRDQFGGEVIAEVNVGRSKESELVAGVFPTAVLNGLIKDVQVFNDALSITDLQQLMEDSKPLSASDLQLNRDWCADDPQRPAYHAQPPRAWTNEPHGLVQWRGEYHLFYQKNPNGPYWGHINWGHMTSPDLYHWTEMPVALCPEPGPDSEGCWSGSVIEHAGKLALIYTGVDGHRASICLAQSSDGVTFTKHPGNPIIPEPPRGLNYSEFRDPFVWREADRYYLIIGSAVKEVGGTALLYRSSDLVTWEYRKPLLVGDRESSGVFWEMPLFVKIGDDHALIVCEVPGRASYWVGKWQEEVFTPYDPAPRRLELFNHLLSPTPYTDQQGQVITMGIIPDQRSPQECWRAGWAHLYSLPRVLSTSSSGHLFQRPLPAIDKWSEATVSLNNLAIPENRTSPAQIAAGRQLKVRFTIKRGESRSVSLFVRRSPDGREQTELRYEWEIGRLVLDRTLSSLDPQVRRDLQETTYFPPKSGLLELTVFLDESVMEVFADDQAAFATRIYPVLESSGQVALVSSGMGAEAENIEVSRLKSLRFHA